MPERARPDPSPLVPPPTGRRSRPVAPPGCRPGRQLGSVLFPAELSRAIADGAVTVAFRRWRRPSVRPGGTLQSPAGLLAIDEVAPVTVGEITDEDAARAGYASAAEVVASLRAEGTLYRIRFRRVGDDPRVALRRERPGPEEMAAIRARLARLPWARSTLRLVADRPGVVSTELAAAQGVERHVFKQRVRRLKALGLTESLDVGYRLAPRGRAVLDSLDDAAPNPDARAPGPPDRVQ